MDSKGSSALSENLLFSLSSSECNFQQGEQESQKSSLSIVLLFCLTTTANAEVSTQLFPEALLKDLSTPPEHFGAVFQLMPF